MTKGVSGIYCWVNKTNGKCYVGKANSMYLRLSNYYQDAYITNHLSSSLICRAINKYTMSQFSLIVLEINPSDLSAAEQYWINLLSPEYNSQKNVLVPFTGVYVQPDRFGINNSFYGRKHSQNAKDALRKSALARLHPNKPGFSVAVTDTATNITTIYPSIRKAVTALN